MSLQIGMYIYHSDWASVLAVQCISGGQGNKEKSWNSEISAYIKSQTVRQYSKLVFLNMMCKARYSWLNH